MWKKILAVLFGVVIGYWFYDDFDPDKLKGKCVVITGASTGIGEQIAYHYARFGANILITARREKVLQQVIERCRQLGSGQFEYVTADMDNLTSTENVIREAVQRLGGIDILVLNHIMKSPLGPWVGSPQNLTLLKSVLNVNFQSYVYLASHAQQHLERSRGSIVVVSSLAGKVAVPFISPYSASKFALDGFFGSFRQELRMLNSNISVTLCVIGMVGTQNSLDNLKDFGMDGLLSSIPIASPNDTALAIIKGGVSRARQIYFPYMEVRIPCLIRDVLPETLDFVLRYVSTPTQSN